MLITRSAAAALVAALVLGAACQEATRPRGGVPTIDALASDGFVAVTAGREHTCALTADSLAHCWGSNEFGQLGTDDVTACPRDDRNIPCQRRPVPVGGGIKFRKISAGGTHTCALAADDRIYCWGDNARGALGDPGVRQSITPVPVVTTALFTDVSSGGEHSCGLRSDGAALCWGANDWSQLGITSLTSSFALPVTVATAQRFASISAGERRTCARTAEGAAYCWGATFVNQSGGADLLRAQQTPAAVSSPAAFRTLSVGTSTTCGISVDNEALCWEGNSRGSIGDGTASGSTTPIVVAGAVTFVAVSSGDAHTCGLADTGLAYCWGGGGVGELGISPAFLDLRCGADRVPCRPRPERVSGERIFVQISAGQGSHACALSFGGSVYCWGAGGMGQRGDGRASRGEWAPVRTFPPRILPAM